MVVHAASGRCLDDAAGGPAATIEHRGVLTAAMVYDALPVIDVFRRVGPDVLLGAMDMRGLPTVLLPAAAGLIGAGHIRRPPTAATTTTLPSAASCSRGANSGATK